MNNSQLYPFERNRYYPRKRMSSNDFTAEQTYMNNKRRFMNGLMYGAGVVCGLGVFSLDDLSLLVESGVAIDGMGREIVVETSDVKKLSAISGFESLRTDKASLCLRYKEQDVHKVYAFDQEDPSAEFQYNRVREGYSLFLMDTDEIPEIFEMESEFLLQAMLLADENYQINFKIPASVSRGHSVKAVIEIEKLSDRDVSLSYFGKIQTPALITPEKDSVINIELEDVFLDEGQVVTYDYWFDVADVPVQKSNIILEAGSARAFENDLAVEVPTNFSIEITLSDAKPRELVNREIGRLNLEMKNIGGQDDYIRIADLKLMRTENAYIIEEVIEAGVKKYVTAPAQQMLRGDYLDFFVKEVEITGNTVTAVEETGRTYEDDRRVIPEIATGTLEIPLGEDAGRGDIYYSGEIMHGLGKGNVYVEVGSDIISEDESVGASSKSVIYGNPNIFAGEVKNIVPAETAVRVSTEKGSFIVGAKLLGNVDYIVLNYRWIAIKFPAAEDLIEEEDIEGASISPETPTVRMGTKESHYFGVSFNNIDPMSITYEMTENGSGEITADGVYTASSKPGVYEIRIFCTDVPKLCTYAYAIVERRGSRDDGQKTKAEAMADKLRNNI